MLPYDWAEFFRWPAQGDRWTLASYVVLIPKLLLTAAAFAVVIVVVMIAVSLPLAVFVILAHLTGLPTGLTAILGTGVVLASLVLFGGLLDY